MVWKKNDVQMHLGWSVVSISTDPPSAVHGDHFADNIFSGLRQKQKVVGLEKEDLTNFNPIFWLHFR